MVSQLETPALNLERPIIPKVEGLVQIFTGGQRYFFTGVMAEALRIASQGMPVLVVQFLKGGIGQGPDRPVQLGQNLDWVRCDLPRCIDTPSMSPESAIRTTPETSKIDEVETSCLQQLWDWTQEIVFTGKYSLVVLDELSLAIKLGLIPEEEVLALLEKRPPHIDIILTGPEMPPVLLDVADQITEIRRSHRP